MPITAQQLLQILPNAGKQAGVFASALNLATDRYQINTKDAHGGVHRPGRA
jgi:putative chitinase